MPKFPVREGDRVVMKLPNGYIGTMWYSPNSAVICPVNTKIYQPWEVTVIGYAADDPYVHQIAHNLLESYRGMDS
jgi:hypothetical protein